MPLPEKLLPEARLLEFRVVEITEDPIRGREYPVLDDNKEMQSADG